MQTLVIRLLSTLCFAFSASVLFGDEVDAVLKRWSEHVVARRGGVSHGTARLYTYDSVFQVETRRLVEFWTDGKDRWQIDFTPADVTGQTSRKIASDGSTYRLQTSEKCERWARIGPSLIRQVGAKNESPSITRHALTAFEVQEARSQLEQIADWPTICAEGLALPLHLCRSGPAIIGSREDAAAHNWLLELGNMHGKDTRVHLVLTPPEELHEFAGPRYEILLKANDFSPIAIKVVDPYRTSESVYAFIEIEDLPDDAGIIDYPEIQAWPPGSSVPFQQLPELRPIFRVPG